MSTKTSTESTSNYWARYENSIFDEMRRDGITNLRGHARGPGSTASFGGGAGIGVGKGPLLNIDPFDSRWESWDESGFVWYWNRLINRVARHFPQFGILASRIALAREVASDFQNAIFQSQFGLLEQLVPEWMLDAAIEPDTGSPVQFSARGKNWSGPWLKELAQVASMERCGFRSDGQVIREIGGGIGLKALLITQLYPSTTVIFVDIPPALAVAEAYLSIARTGGVCGYRQTKETESVYLGSGDRIFMVAPWQVDKIPSMSVDGAINTGSFQEMEEEQVQFYGGLIKRTVKDFVWHANLISGHDQAMRKGDHGVLAPVSSVFIEQTLAPEFSLRDSRMAFTLTGKSNDSVEQAYDRL